MRSRAASTICGKVAKSVVALQWHEVKQPNNQLWSGCPGSRQVRYKAFCEFCGDDGLMACLLFGVGEHIFLAS